MIPKVNRPPQLSLVSATKTSDFDPGSSQGGGNLYEKHEKPTPQNAPQPQKEKPTLELVEDLEARQQITQSEQIGLSEVVLEFRRAHKSEVPQNPGLSIRYQSDSQSAKGLLLNRKAE